MTLSLRRAGLIAGLGIAAFNTKPLLASVEPRATPPSLPDQYKSQNAILADKVVKLAAEWNALCPEIYAAKGFSIAGLLSEIDASYHVKNGLSCLTNEKFFKEIENPLSQKKYANLFEERLDSIQKFHPGYIVSLNCAIIDAYKIYDVRLYNEMDKRFRQFLKLKDPQSQTNYLKDLQKNFFPNLKNSNFSLFVSLFINTDVPIFRSFSSDNKILALNIIVEETRRRSFYLGKQPRTHEDWYDLYTIQGMALQSFNENYKYSQKFEERWEKNKQKFLKALAKNKKINVDDKQWIKRWSFQQKQKPLYYIINTFNRSTDLPLEVEFGFNTRKNLPDGSKHAGAYVRNGFKISDGKKILLNPHMGVANDQLWLGTFRQNARIVGHELIHVNDWFDPEARALMRVSGVFNEFNDDQSPAEYHAYSLMNEFGDQIYEAMTGKKTNVKSTNAQSSLLANQSLRRSAVRRHARPAHP